ncbi:MAG: hypothetical protein HOD11_13945 [Candidatus Marinimicrobia bacterium]|nr:hypothetical protein [Candidatus Neomarinimicrobiota bacterium]
MSLIDLLAAAFTIVLFIILAYKIYNNTKQMRGTAKKSGSGKADDMMHDFMDQPVLWAKLSKGLEASGPDEELSMTLMVNAAFQGFQAQCEEADGGTLDENEILALEEGVHRICAMPGVAKYLEDLKPDFSQRLLAIIDQTP